MSMTRVSPPAELGVSSILRSTFRSERVSCVEEPRFIEPLDFAVLLPGQASVGEEVMALILTQPVPAVKTTLEFRPVDPQAPANLIDLP